MNKFFKKLAVLLSFVLVFTAMPMSVFAASEWDGTATTAWYDAGSATTNFTVATAADLAGLAQIVNSGTSFQNMTVTLADNIDLAGKEWTPIGDSDNTFKGTFDGNGKTISNLVITGNKSNVGLFGYTTDGEVKNLTVNNAKVSGRLNVGVVAGTPYTSKYTNVKLTGHVEVNGMSYVGGVGGKNAYVDWTDVTVDVDSSSYVNAVSTENGTAYRTYVGGVIGFIGEGGHTFKNITSNIAVKGDVCDVGGITGIAHYDNKFENVSCSGTVECTTAGETEVGGIAGTWHNMAGKTVTMTNCNFTGTVVIGGEDAKATNSLTGAAYNASNNDRENSGSLLVNGEQVWPAEAKIGDKYYETLAEAVAAAGDGDTVELICDVEVEQSLVIDKAGTITIDGAGYSIKPAAGYTDTQNGLLMLGTTASGDSDVSNRIYTFENVVFEETTDWSVIRSQGVTLTLDGCTVQNCTQTNGQALLRLDHTEAVIKNTTIQNNNALMAIAHNFNGNGSNTSLTVEECTIKNNTFNKTAGIYYVRGGGCEIVDSEFISNTVNCHENGAVVYLGFQEDCKVTGCLFEGNSVNDTSTSTRVAGAIFFGYEAEIKDNAFVNNSASNAASDALGQSICTSIYYDGTIDLSGNYFGGHKPVEGEDYFVQHKDGEGTFVLDNYYSDLALTNLVCICNLEELVPVEKVEPKCTTDGTKAHEKCAICGKLYVDDVEVTAADLVIPQIGHTYGDWAVTTAAKCETAGVETRVCENDAAHKETREVAATGHTFASCSSDDVNHYYKCACGVTYLTGAHEDADNNAVCEWCGYVMVSGATANRQNPNTGVTAEMLK